MCETMSSVIETKAAIRSILEHPGSNSIPILCSFSVNGQGKLRSGETANEAINAILDYTGKDKIEALLFNCGEIEGVLKALESIDDKTKKLMGSTHLGAYPNRLTAVPEG
eukprot:Awhi_evm1s8491